MHFWCAEATAVAIPEQNRASGVFSHSEHTRLMRHVLNQFIIAVHIFATDHHRVSTRQSRIRIRPFGGRDTCFSVPLSHPALRGQSKQSRRKTLWQNRVHFVSNRTKM